MTRPIANDTNPLRLGDGVARILFSRERSGTGPFVVELTMPEGAASPLHVHDEDETIFLLQGRVTFTVGSREIEARPNTKLVLPAGVAHAYRVEHAGRARWLVVTETGRLERYLRSVAPPASNPARGGTRLADAAVFADAAAENGIELLGPPPERAAPKLGAAPAHDVARRASRRARSLPLAPASA